MTIENIALKRRLDLTLTYSNIISFAAVSIFLPYILSAIVMTFLAVYIILNKYTRQLIFIHKGSNLLKIFFGYVLIIPLLYKNWLGLLVGVGMIMAMTFGLFMRSVMTKELYERVLHLICIMSLTSAGYAIVEKLLNSLLDSRHSHRIASVFSHPNYFGTIVGTVIIICAYKLLTHQGNKIFYILVGLVNTVSIYLCKSMFVWMEVFIGVTVLLLMLKYYRLLLLWLSTAVAGGIAIFILKLPIIPRLSDMNVTISLREQIWALAVRQIKANPLFGHGFMSFSFIYDSSIKNNRIPHAHSIYLDMLMNFGIVGSMLFLWFLCKYYLSLFYTRIKENNTIITSLILAVSVAALVHGATDMTLLWIQTFPLFLIIVSGLGADEKNGRYHINADWFF
ncbi:MAG: O-antigen ligase family protein [Firmicutes bacterium]|nr:O-antigen ligase family protein [Bacillota bacterium]